MENQMFWGTVKSPPAKDAKVKNCVTVNDEVPLMPTV